MDTQTVISQNKNTEISQIIFMHPFLLGIHFGISYAVNIAKKAAK